MPIVVRTFDELAAAVEQAEVELQELLIEAMNLAIADTFEMALQMSSGNVTPYELRHEGSPYARRHGQPLLDPAIINEQSGLFKSSWRAELVTVVKSLSVDGSITNDAPYADLLVKGTKFMFARPIDKALEAYMDERIRFHVKNAMDLFDSEYG